MIILSIVFVWRLNCLELVRYKCFQDEMTCSYLVISYIYILLKYSSYPPPHSSAHKQGWQFFTIYLFLSAGFVDKHWSQKFCCTFLWVLQILYIDLTYKSTGFPTKDLNDDEKLIKHKYLRVNCVDLAQLIYFMICRRKERFPVLRIQYRKKNARLNFVQSSL